MTDAVTYANPLLEAAERMPCRCEYPLVYGPQFGCPMCADGPIGSQEWLDRHEARWELARKYAWAIPNESALSAIARLSPIVEIGAGTGYWASLLAARGADIVAYDERPGFNGWRDHEPYHPIAIGGPEVLAAHRDRTLFLCWPPMTDMAARCLEHYTGDRLVYIGESDGGCNGDEAFFGALDREWDEIGTVDIPRWWAIRDTLVIYGRRA